MSNETLEITRVLATLRDPHTIRTRAQAILNLVKQGQSAYFFLDPEKMAATATFVIEVMQDNYPNFDIPYHSRWRHFEVGGIDRIKNMIEGSYLEVLYELVIISVLLDAGAGQYWRYKEPETGVEYTRSEGLALASLSLYQDGVFSANPKEPFRVDAQRLVTLDKHDLQKGFQVTANNPLEGIEGRVDLLNNLGKSIQRNVLYFGEEGRLGNFYTYIKSLVTHHSLSTAAIFQAVLNAFSGIWPERLLFHGISLGDVWQHNALKTSHPGSQYIPFHKLSQWLTYSLIEPLEQTGIKILDLDVLTGLPEYRNGGLMIDSGLLGLKNNEVLKQAYTPDSEIIVEWRALTIALLDELADVIRKKLQKSNQELPLAKILQGGTWEAGRRLAKQKRPYGLPPIQIISDGTVF